MERREGRISMLRSAESDIPYIYTGAFGLLTYAPRSGSTLLAKLMNQYSSTVLILPEFRLWERIVMLPAGGYLPEDSTEVGRWIAEDWQFHNLGFDREICNSLCRWMAGESAADAIRLLVGVAASIWGRKIEIVFLKRGDGFIFANDLKNFFGEVFFIHMTRDPRGVLNSTLHSPHPYRPGETMGWNDPLWILRRWRRAEQDKERFKERGNHRVLQVRFESLVSAPSNTVESVLEWLGDSGESRPRKAIPTPSGREASTHPLINEEPREDRATAWRNELPLPLQQFTSRYLASQLHSQDYPAIETISLGRFAVLYAFYYIVHVWSLLRRSLALARRIIRKRRGLGYPLHISLRRRYRDRRRR